MQAYSVGFLFDPDYKRVVLIHKLKPEWQKGLLNGPGGKIEFGETPIETMRREFGEETGVYGLAWTPVCELQGRDWKVFFFKASSIFVDDVKTMEEEQVEVIELQALDGLPLIPNLYWIINMCTDPNHEYAHCYAKS